MSSESDGKSIESGKGPLPLSSTDSGVGEEVILNNNQLSTEQLEQMVSE